MAWPRGHPADSGIEQTSESARLYRVFILISLLLFATAISWPGEFSSALTLGLPLLAIALAGLPHGALDIHIALNAARSRDGASRFDILSVYVAIGLIGGAAWIIAPAYLVVFFLALSVWHFSGDFRALGRGPAIGIAASLLLMPMIAHPAQTQAIFAMLMAEGDAARLVETAALAWPVIALCALATAFRAARAPWTALAGALAVAAGYVLPPVAAFALYFAALHSPLHVREVLRRDPVDRERMKEAGLYAGLTFGLLAGLAALWWANDAHAPLTGALFGLLIVLTLPHMAIVERWQRPG